MENFVNPLFKDYNKLDYYDRIRLYELVLNTKDPKYFNLVVKLIFNDTLRRYQDTRYSLTFCLGIYKTEQCKKVLCQLLNDPSLNIIAAVVLQQIGAADLRLVI